MGFKLPEVFEASTSTGVPLFGPASSAIPAEFTDIPYETFSKSDRSHNLPRPADWFSSDPSYAASSSGAGGSKGGLRGARTNLYEAGGEDEGTFSLVDKSGSGTRGGRGGPGGASGGPSLGGASRGGGRYGGPGGRGGRGGAAGAGGRGGGRGGYYGRGRGGTHILGRGGFSGRGRWGDQQKTRAATVNVRSDWQVLEEIDFPRLGKLRLDVDTEDPEDVGQYGFVSEYDKSYDRVNTRQPVPLQVIDRVHYNPTSSDDPIIQELASRNRAKIFTTDNVLSVLMCSTRSVYPWDIVIVREGDKIFIDKRDSDEGPFDLLSVNENAAEPPSEAEKPKDGRHDDSKDINSPSALSLEATYVNNTFTWQVVRDDGDASSRIDFAHPNPFYSSEEVNPPASCGYRYRKFDLSVNEDEEMDMVVRTEVDTYIRGAPSATSTVSTSEFNKPDTEQITYTTVKTLFEFDHRAAGAGGAPDWRTKLDSQRGAVVATEMKNNSFKLARFAVQSILAGAEQMKMGYISRASPKDDNRHVILGTQWYKPRDFAVQMNVNLANGFGIVRTIVDLIMKQPEGKFCLIRDPNSPMIRLYRIPFDAFEPADEEDAEEGRTDGGSDADGFTVV